MKKYIDILGIVLPAIIIVLGIVRVFVKKTKGVNGLTMILAIILLITGLVRYFVFPGNGGSSHSGNKPQPIAVSKHSDFFNNSVEDVLNAYYQLTEGFVNWDTAAINTRPVQ